MTQANDAPPREQAITEITAEIDDLIAAWLDKDAARILGHFSEDVHIFAAEVSTIGREATAEYLGYATNEERFELKMTKRRVDAAQSGELGYGSGSFQLTYPNPESDELEVIEGNFTTIFKRGTDGAWEIVEDISTPGPPAL